MCLCSQDIHPYKLMQLIVYIHTYCKLISLINTSYQPPAPSPHARTGKSFLQYLEINYTLKYPIHICAQCILLFVLRNLRYGIYLLKLVLVHAPHQTVLILVLQCLDMIKNIVMIQGNVNTTITTTTPPHTQRTWVTTPCLYHYTA